MDERVMEELFRDVCGLLRCDTTIDFSRFTDLCNLFCDNWFASALFDKSYAAIQICK